MSLQDDIKNRRKDLGLTMKELADMVGVSEATISRWESGDIENMRRQHILPLAKALGVSPSFIMGWNDAIDLSKLIAQLMNILSLSYEDAAFETGISEATLKKYAKGEIKNIPKEDIQKISAAFGLTMADFFDDRWPIILSDTKPDISPQEAREKLILMGYRYLDDTDKDIIFHQLWDMLKAEKYKDTDFTIKP